MKLRPLLAGGDRRDIAQSDRARRLVGQKPARITQLAALAGDADPLVAQRAVDLLEKIAHERPELIEAHKRIFIGPLADSDRWEIRLQIVRAIPLFRWNTAERRRAISILRKNLSNEQTFVRAWALDSLAAFAESDKALMPFVKRALKIFRASPSKALQARARKISERLPR